MVTVSDPILQTLSYSPTCIDKCPAENTTAIACKATSKVSESQCTGFFDPPTNLNDHVGYGTLQIFNKFCLPDIDKLPPQIDITKYNEIILDFGVDDIQEAYEDILDAKMSYLYCTLTCLVVALAYNILLSYFANIIIWISILATGFGILAMSLFLQDYHTKNYGEGSTKS